MATLETARLYLRMFTPADLPSLFKILSDPDVVRYVGSGKPSSMEETEIAFNSMVRHWKRHGFGRWAVVEKATDQFIGFGGLRLLIDRPEVVYHLAKSYWGKGIATEMASASLRFGFEENGFERIVAIAKPGNEASIRVMQKIGMNFDKYAQYYNIDVVEYSLSREQYKSEESLYILHDN